MVTFCEVAEKSNCDGNIGEYTSTHNVYPRVLVYHSWITNTLMWVMLNFDLTTIIFTNLYIYYYDFNRGACMIFIYIGQ